MGHLLLKTCSFLKSHISNINNIDSCFCSSGNVSSIESNTAVKVFSVDLETSGYQEIVTTLKLNVVFVDLETSCL